MSENKRVTIPFLEKVLKPIVDLIHTKADKTDILQSDWNQTDETQKNFIKNKPEDLAYTSDISDAIANIPQVDWNQNDENDDSYVRNRTHYVYVEEEVIVPETTAATTTLYSGNGFDIPNPSCENPFIEGRTYIVTWNGVDYSVIATEDSDATALYVQENGLLAVGFMPDEPNIVRVVTDDALGTVNTLKVTCRAELVSCLDEKYIPDTIARKSDIENFESNVQPDWNQHNETEQDYIKNRPFYHHIKTWELTGISQELSSTFVFFKDLYGLYNTEIDFDVSKSYRMTLGIDVVLDSENNNIHTFNCEMSSNVNLSTTYALLYSVGTLNINSVDYTYTLRIVDASPGGNISLQLTTVPSGIKQTITGLRIQLDEILPIEECTIPDAIARTKNVPTVDSTLAIEGAAADAKTVGDKILAPRPYITMVDQVSGHVYIVSIENGNLVSRVGIKHIEVTTPPNLTEYMHGEYFDPTGMVVTATYADDTTVDIVDYTYPTSFLKADVPPKISYTDFGVTYDAVIPITINAFDPSTVLVDFVYTDNKDGTYTLLEWKGTHNGEPSDKLVIPNYACIIV